MTLQTYDIAAGAFSIVLDVFFREIKPRGSHKVPKDGPVIFVAAPHANQVKLKFIGKKSKPKSSISVATTAVIVIEIGVSR
ncbi:13314_t:CDS:1, partial [Gigaspora rosea]